jgi:FAD dependent oxidoreductase/S-layer homology domain
MFSLSFKNVARIGLAALVASVLSCGQLEFSGEEFAAGDRAEPGEGTVALTGTITCPVLVVGGSTAAAVAALSAAREGATVCLAQPTNRLGGQYTDQALPAPDEGPVGKAVGDDKAYSKAQASFRARMRALSSGKANPGACWVSPLCTSVSTAKQAFDEALAPFVANGRLRILSNVVPTSVNSSTVGGRRKVTGVNFRDIANSSDFTANATVTIEATDLGDILELGDIESRVGQEARGDTGEAPLPTVACPRCQQAFTFGIIAERSPANVTPVAAPAGYGTSAWVSNYTDTYWAGSASGPTPRAFYAGYSVFNYRRLTSSSSSVGSAGATGDVAVLNWGCQVQGAAGAPKKCGNDYEGGPLTGVSRSERALELSRGRDRAQGYLRFLQTGSAPDLKPRADLSGAAFGIAAQPYIREARRGIAQTTVGWGDITAATRPNDSRSKLFDDTVGIGDYFYMDTHPNGEPGSFTLSDTDARTKPFGIPAGALVPANTDGLVLSSKSLGTTHLTNAAYRMHPVEWAIGEASGALAARAVLQNVAPRDLLSTANVRRLQYSLISNGVPLVWFDDVAHGSADFASIHYAAAAKFVGPQSNSTLKFSPDTQINRGQAAASLVRAMGWTTVSPSTPTFSDVPSTFYAYAAIETLVARGVIVKGVGTFSPSQTLSRADLKAWITSAAGASVSATAFASTSADSTPAVRRELARVLTSVNRSVLQIF